MTRLRRPLVAALLALVALARAPELGESYFRHYEGLVNKDDEQLIVTLQRQCPGDPLPLLAAWSFRWTAIGLYCADLLAGDLHPVAFHAVSLTIHLGSTALVAFLAAELGLSAAASLGAAALFGVLSLHHETLRWLLGRFDLLASAFSLASALLLLRWTRAPERRRLYVCSLVAAALAACSKESAVALGPLAAWLVWVRARGTARAGVANALRATWPFLALTAAVLVVGTTATGFSNAASLRFGWAQIATAAFDVFPRFLGGAYRSEGTLGVSTFAGAALLAACFLGREGRSAALAAAGGLGAALAVIHAVVASSALPNHFYLPSAWLAVLVAAGADGLAARGGVARGAAIALLGAALLENLLRSVV